MRERTQMLSVTSTGIFLSGLVWYNYSALLPQITEAWSLSGFAAGALFAAFQFGYVLAILPVGILTDQRSTRLVIAVGCTGTGLASIAFGVVADGFLVGTALRMLAGGVMAGVYMPGIRFLSEWYPDDRRGTAIGIHVGALYSDSRSGSKSSCSSAWGAAASR